MGEVYQAHDSNLRRDVAIKVLPEAFAHDADRLSRFRREAQLLASLNHPNIATIHGLEDSNGTSYLVMELVPGETLAQRIKRDGAVPVEEALAIAKQIAEALEAAHEKGIIHRDLKPANVKLTPEEKVKVLDFGLAKAFAGDTSTEDMGNSPTLSMAATMQGVILGTAAYMSPEQAKGKQVDKRTDIWAFGAVLYELLTGKPAFHGEDVGDILAEVVKAEPAFDALPANISPSIRVLLQRCLRKDRRQRTPDAATIRIEIEDAIAAPKDSGVTQTAPTSMSKLLLAVAAALTIIAVVALWVAWRSTHQEAYALPLMRLDVDLGPDALPASSYYALITAAISPDGTQIVYPARGADGRQMLAIRPLDKATGTPLAGTENGFDPFFSPDGQWIGFFSDSKLKKVSINGGALTVLCSASNSRGASWNEDGTIVAALTNTAGLSIVSAAGGEPKKLTELKPGESTHRWPQVLPGGKVVVFTASSSLSDYNGATIEALTLKTGERTVIQRGGFFGRYASSGHLLFTRDGSLYAVPLDASGLKPKGDPVPILGDLASDPSSGSGQFDVSRTGVFIYRSGKAGEQTWSVVSLDGSGKVQALLPESASYFTPRFSPDGRRVAVGIESGKGVDIYTYNLQQNALTRLTFAGAVDYNPVWTPDGGHIAFSANSPEGYTLSWIRSDGAGGPVQLIADKSPMLPFSFSGDGKRLAYQQLDPDDHFELWTVSLDLSDPDHPKPGKPEVFARTPANEMLPAFSPDGRWLAYSSDESGTYEIYVRPFPLAGGSKWQVSFGGGKVPFWSRDGKNLYFQTPDLRIMVAAYKASGDSFLAEKPRLWSDKQLFAPTPNDAHLDLAPDGARFAALMPTSTQKDAKGTVHETFLLNFFNELRRRTATPGK
jgi:serine/threonine-protein kinase